MTKILIMNSSGKVDRRKNQTESMRCCKPQSGTEVEPSQRNDKVDGAACVEHTWIVQRLEAAGIRGRMLLGRYRLPVTGEFG